MFDVLGLRVAWLKVTSYASIESCELKRKRLDGKTDEEELPGYVGIPDTDSLQLRLQFNAG